jgi:hypothetical protein
VNKWPSGRAVGEGGERERGRDEVRAEERE